VLREEYSRAIETEKVFPEFTLCYEISFFRIIGGAVPSTAPALVKTKCYESLSGCCGRSLRRPRLVHP